MQKTGSMTMLGQGFTQAASKRSILGILYGFTLLVTLPVALAFRAAFSDLIGSMPAIDELFGGYVYTVWNDITRLHADAVTAFRSMFVPAMLVSAVMHAILGVGLARVMDTKGGVREFFGGMVTFGWRAVRLLFVFVLYGGIVLVAAGLLSSVLFSALTDGNAIESDYRNGAIVVVIIMGLSLALVILGAEYARIFAVRENRHSMFKAGWDGLVFVLTHPLRMLSLHGLVFLSLLAAALLYWLLDGLIGMTSTAGLALMFIIQQMFVLYRLFIRMWNTSNGVVLCSRIAEEKRSTIVKAPSVHDRTTTYREPPVEESASSAQGARRQGQRRPERSGQRRRGRRRGPGRGRGGGGSGSGSTEKTESKKGSSSTSGRQKQTDQKSGKQQRRRRRPPRRRGSKPSE